MKQEFVIGLPIDEVVFITMFITKDAAEQEENKHLVILVALHGKGILTFYDMGSFQTMFELISAETEIAIKAMEYPLTLIALDSNRNIMLGMELDEIHKSLSENYNNMICSQEEIYYKSNTDNVILTLYMSGEGAAVQYATMTVEENNEESSDKPDADQQRAFSEGGVFKGAVNSFLVKREFSWEIDPVGFRNTMRELNDRYDLPLIVTENGLGVRDTVAENGAINDDYRIDYLQKHIEQARLDITDGVKLFGYCPWSAIDLISTHAGCSKRYGFIYVNRDEFDLKGLKRLKKKSFYWYKKVIASNGTSLENID